MWNCFAQLPAQRSCLVKNFLVVVQLETSLGLKWVFPLCLLPFAYIPSLWSDMGCTIFLRPWFFFRALLFWKCFLKINSKSGHSRMQVSPFTRGQALQPWTSGVTSRWFRTPDLPNIPGPDKGTPPGSLFSGSPVKSQTILKIMTYY